MSASPRLLLALASVAVAFAAADTYVVVLVLPEMSTSVGVSPEELQRAAPIVSGFLLGYIAMLPLIGRIADLRGRVPVLVAALVLFAVGSLVTTLSYDMTSMVGGRFLQGVGGGGLVPATLALVADLYPADRRGVPLGVVSAVQEIGSVLGPLFGAVVMALADDWRVIFAVNLVVGVVLALAVRALARTAPADGDPPDPGRGRMAGLDWPGILLLLVLTAASALVFLQPAQLMRDLTWGQLFIPVVAQGRWLTPVGLVALGAAALLLLRWLTAARPLVDVRGWARSSREADLVGALFLAAALGGVILAFATADPEVEVFSDQGGWYLLGAALATAAFVIHVRRSESPIVPRGALRRTPAWGGVLVSFFVGACLIAALIDIPLFARSTVHRDSQLLAALVLVRFLVALPIGAVVGGYLTRRYSAGLITAGGMVLAAVGFGWMSTWEADALEHLSSNLPLVLTGLGFGLALAPVNAAVLASTEHVVHGVASALVVVARMVGMLVGISVLTTIGLRAYYAEQDDLPSVREVCDGKSRCPAFSDLLRDAGVAQEQTVFLGAALCAVVAAGLALVLFRGAETRALSTGDLLRAAG
ncbi:MFS transporter [Nocardioides pantholopis]|uniref:MFS transporter n=1 Tax=Nocardioides pantholopis TaxID=2483798 RepID=UPI000F08FA1A|nr:MFS transporter [Nocardioides pantholopis]